MISVSGTLAFLLGIDGIILTQFILKCIIEQKLPMLHPYTILVVRHSKNNFGLYLISCMYQLVSTNLPRLSCEQNFRKPNTHQNQSKQNDLIQLLCPDF